MMIRNGSVELNVVEDGDPSAPPILLLHGITSFGGTWDWFVPELAERFRVLRLDFRGHGESDRAEGEYSSSGYVSDAVAAIEQVAGKPVVVMGHSLGGVTAAALTQRRPDLLRGAILEDPPLGLAPTADSESTTPLEGNALLAGFTLMRQSIPQLQSSGIQAEMLAGVLKAAPDTTGASTFGEKLHADGLSSMSRAMLLVDASVLDPVLEGNIEAFLDPTVGFGVPTLVVTADPSNPDAAADPALAQHFAERSADVEVLTVAGAGHLIHDEHGSRETFRAAVLAFLDGLD
ncbi:MAG: alpha/beta hydrolase [Ilumatobacteraceae bacterium]